MRIVRRSALVALMIIPLVGCGTTVVDTSITAARNTTTTTLTPLDRDAPLGELLTVVIDGLGALPELVIEGDDEAVLARVDEAWSAAEPLLRTERPELLFGFEQAVELGRTAVERRRPADASKGYKIAVDVFAEL